MKIEVLYPEFGNLFGDLSNINYLKKCMPEAEFIETSINDEPAFVKGKVDLIYLGPCTEQKQELIIEKLKPHKEKIEEMIDNGTVFLWTGNSLEILGKYIENEDGSKVECLGIFDVYSKRDMLHRENSNVLGNFEDIEIVGFQSQFTKMYGNIENNYFLKLQLGIGINDKNELEGIRKNNFIGTYVIGPILILNPLFTNYLIKAMGEEEPRLALEKETMAAYEARLKEYKQKFLNKETK